MYETKKPDYRDGISSAAGRTSGASRGAAGGTRPVGPAVSAEERAAAALDLPLPLPPTLTLTQVQKLYGIGRGLAYAAAADGTIPSRRVGHKLVWPTALILADLGGER